MSTQKTKIIIAESMAEDGINLLRFQPNIELIVLDKKDKDKLEKEIVDASALIVRSGVKATADLIQKAKKLKIVGRAGAGYDNIDVKACSEKGIVVMVASGGNTNGVVELTIGLMFALIRHIPEADKTMKEGIWAKNQLNGSELSGKTIGLVGLGKIGGRVAEICQSLGMRVIAMVSNKNKKRDVSFHGEFVDTLDEMLPNVDFLSLHVPLNEKTKHLIGKNEFQKMKPRAFLINTSRGEVVDEDALSNALNEKKIAGAAIDVYSVEPAAKDKFKFIEMKNVVALPHLGASTDESQANVSRIICQNLIEGLESDIFIDAVNLPFSIPMEIAQEYRPFIILAKRLGQLSGQFLDKPIKKIKILYRARNIKDIKPIVMTLCSEALKYKYVGVNLINVEKQLNEEDIGLFISHDSDLSYDNSLEVQITCDDASEFQVKGTYLAGIPKIVEIQKIKLEIVPAGRMLLIRNMNVPGVIGEIGSLLGVKGINIAEMHLGRSTIGGETKGAVFVDTEVPKEIIAELKSLKNIVDAKMIMFD